MSLPVVTVLATYRAVDGQPAKGRILFRLLAPLVDVNDNVLVPASTATVVLDQAGSLSHALVPSDAAGIAPNPVAYEITEQVPGGRKYQLLIPGASSTVRLADLAPLVTAVPSSDTDAGDTRALSAANSRAAALGLILGA